MKKIIPFLVIILLNITSCVDSKDNESQGTPVITQTGRLELAEVGAQSAFIVDNSNFWGKQVGIYQTGAVTYTAYINLDDVDIATDDQKKVYTITCPEIKISDSKYQPLETKEIYTTSGFLRKDVSVKDYHEHEEKELENMKGELAKNKDFKENLISQAKESAKTFLPNMLSKIDPEYTIEVKFSK